MSKVIITWFYQLAKPMITTIKPTNRYNIDEASIIEGMGTNSLVLRTLGKQ